MKKKGRNVSTLGQKMTRNTDKIRKIAFKLRGGLWTALYLGVLFLAGPASIPALAAGLILVAIGQSVRFWAAGCITRYRGENVGAERLVTWGPYALVRNPLYVGNGLIGAGWGILAGWKALLLFAAAFFVLYGVLIVPWEETFLRTKFGREYENYASRTGRFFPRKTVGFSLKGPFDHSVLWKSERHSLFVTLAGTAVLLFRVL